MNPPPPPFPSFPSTPSPLIHHPSPFLSPVHLLLSKPLLKPAINARNHLREGSKPTVQ